MGNHVLDETSLHNNIPMQITILRIFYWEENLVQLAEVLGIRKLLHVISLQKFSQEQYLDRYLTNVEIDLYMVLFRTLDKF